MRTKKTQHLLFVINSLHFGGAEKHVISLLNHLDTDKFTLSLACLKQDEAILSQLDISRLKSFFTCHVQHKIDLTAVKLLAQYIDEKHVDIVVCTNQYPMLYGLLAKIKAAYPCKVVVVFHTTLPARLSDNLYWLFYKHVFKRCDHIVFVSENQARYWLKDRGMTVLQHSVIQNGIDAEKFTEFKLPEDKRHDLVEKHGIKPHAFIVGICAVLRPEKKHTDLIQAINQIQSKGVNAGLIIIGDGEERQKIADYAATFPSLKQSIYFVGFQQDVRPFVTLCDCMVIASHSIETFSISALESMALGKPMVMTDIGGASEQINHGQNGFLYQAGDINTLAKYLMELVEPNPKKAMGTSAKETVSAKFSLPGMVRKFETLFSGTGR